MSTGDSSPNPTWYDILGVDRSATPEQIKAAWRNATDKFEPGAGSSQFGLFNEAADVLLNPERRASYDARLAQQATPSETADEAAPGQASDRADEAPSPVTGPDTAVEAAPVTHEETRSRNPFRRPGAGTDKPPAPEPAPDRAPARASDEPSQERAGRSRPVTVLAALTALAVVAAIVAAVLVFGKAQDQRQLDEVASAGDSASAAAERALVAVLSYDYRQMDTDRDTALRFLSESYAKEYSDTFDKLLVEGADGKPGNAAKTKTVVKATVMNVGVMDASEDKVRVLAFVNQVSSKGAAAPVVFQNRVAATLVKSGNNWLIDSMRSY